MQNKKTKDPYGSDIYDSESDHLLQYRLFQHKNHRIAYLMDKKAQALKRVDLHQRYFFFQKAKVFLLLKKVFLLLKKVFLLK